MKTSIRSRRLRNIHQHEDNQKDPFFSQTSERGQRQFFNAQQGSGQAVQEKLTVGKPGDRYEQEADRVASDVVANNNDQSSGMQRQGLGSIQRISLMSPVEDEKLGTAEARMEKDKLIQEKIQRMGGQKEEEEKIQAKEEEKVQAKEEEEEVQAKEEEEVQAKEEEEEVQAKEEGGGVVTSNVSEKIKKSTGGIPLSGEVRDEMERAFGVDFSGVKIHTDEDAVRMNRQLCSQAFTRGQDIFFNEGKYRPETGAGKQLLAHELAHVVQQCGRKVAANNKNLK